MFRAGYNVLCSNNQEEQYGNERESAAVDGQGKKFAQILTRKAFEQLLRIFGE